MKLILIEDVQNLGYKDDVVTVRDGYGRNYLIPQGKAVIASPSALKVLAENQKQRAHKLAKILQDAKDFAAKLESITFSIPAKASESGKIYGSVTNIQIADELAKLGLAVDRKTILLKEAVKEVGSHNVTIKLHREVSVEITFEVIAE